MVRWLCGVSLLGSALAWFSGSRPMGKKSQEACSSCAQLLAFGAVKRNVDDGFEIDRNALVLGRTEFPLRQRAHGVRIELRVNSLHQLDAVDGAVAANHSVENHF